MAVMVNAPIREIIKEVYLKARVLKQNGTPILCGMQKPPKGFKIPKFHWFTPKGE